MNFNPLPRKEGDKSPVRIFAGSQNFNPLPRKEGDCFVHRNYKYLRKYFNPLPRKEGDAQDRRVILSDIAFQSTPS